MRRAQASIISRTSDLDLPQHKLNYVCSFLFGVFTDAWRSVLYVHRNCYTRSDDRQLLIALAPAVIDR